MMGTVELNHMVRPQGAPLWQVRLRSEAVFRGRGPVAQAKVTVLYSIYDAAVAEALLSLCTISQGC